MITTNPFSELSEFMPSIAMQAFVVVMIILVVVGTLFDIIHKKNVKYFFDNAKKSKKSATSTVSQGKKVSIVLKAVASDVLTTSELAGKRRIAHLLGMYGTIIFWVTSAIMIFNYSTPESVAPSILPLLWHIGAIMTFTRLLNEVFGFHFKRFLAFEKFPRRLCTSAGLKKFLSVTI